MSCIYRKGQGKVFFRKILKRVTICLVILGFVIPAASFAQEEDNQRENDSAKISLDVKGMDIVDVLKILSDEGGFNLSISGNVTGKVTLFLKDINVWEALEIVLVSGNLAYEKKGEIIYVMTDRDYELRYGEKYWDKRKVAIFNLKYAKALRIKDLLAQVVSTIGKVIIDEPTNTVVVTDTPDKIIEIGNLVAKVDKPLETKVFELDYLGAEDFEQKLTEIITKEVGVMRFDTVSNKVIITDYPDKLRAIEQIIKAFDEKPLQVLIDAKIVEITPSKKFYSGITWDYWIKQYFKTSGNFAFPSTSTNKITFGTNETSATEEGKYSGIMDFLQIFGNTKVLSTPRILVLNNQEAKILVGTKDVYITSTTSEIGDSATTSQSVNFVDVGVKLYVTPTINKKGYITLKVKPEISSSERTSITSDGQITQIPVVTTSEAETTMIVKDGVNILIGGLRKITHAKERKQVPILGKLPVLGSLFFKNNKDEWSKNELVIILTPRIISGDKSIEAEIQDKLEGEFWETEAKNEFEKKDRSKEIDRKLDGEENKEQVENQEEENEIIGAEEENKPQLQQETDEKRLEESTVEVLSADSPREEEEDSYYLQVAKKIKNYVLSLPFDNNIIAVDKLKDNGKVKVRFSISKDGVLIGDPLVYPEGVEENLASAAKEIIKKSSPFPPFSHTSVKEEETYEIMLAF